MRQLSGRLEIMSQPNEGTVVTAILPTSELLDEIRLVMLLPGRETKNKCWAK